MKAPDSGIAAEEARIRAVYGARNWSGYATTEPANLAMAQDRERRVLRLLRDSGMMPLAGLDIVDVGCGAGWWLGDLIRWGADPERLTGVDIRPDSLATAASRLPSTVRLLQVNGTSTGLPSHGFDLVVHATVMSSVLDPGVRQRLAAELVRLVRGGAGAILWYDLHMNNPANPDVRRVGRRELSQLFPGATIHLERATLAPPIARMVAPRLDLLARVFQLVPWLRTHYVGIIRPR